MDSSSCSFEQINLVFLYFLNVYCKRLPVF